jgi:hypothetical protein
VFLICAGEANGGQEPAGDPECCRVPEQSKVAFRALCLSAVVIRGELEMVAHMCEDAGVPPEGLHERVEALKKWLRSEGVEQHLSDVERGLFARPLGSWEEQAMIDASWRKESLGVLLWALSVLDAMPAYDEEFPEKVHMERVGWLRPASEFLSKVKVRSPEEIGRARDIAELWHWRARTRQLQEQGYKPPDEFGSLDEIVRTAARVAHKDGDIPRPIEGDFPAFGKAYRDLTEEEYSRTTSIAMERHFALNWLCGYAEDWDEVPTDT